MTAFVFQGLILLAGAVPAVYLGLFLVGRGAATLRLARFGWILLTVAATGMMLATIWYGRGLAQLKLPAALLALSFALIGARRFWVFRAHASELQAALRFACQRLFLPFTESAGNGFVLMEGGKEARRLRFLWSARGYALVMLPPPSGRGKVALLLRWLSKQYPGPIPKIHIVLKERDSHD